MLALRGPPPELAQENNARQHSNPSAIKFYATSVSVLLYALEAHLPVHSGSETGYDLAKSAWAYSVTFVALRVRSHRWPGSRWPVVRLRG